MRTFVYKFAAVAGGLQLAAGLLIADGGAVLSRTRRGSLIVTVFAAPVPLRAGMADLSIMAQKATSGYPVLNADIVLRLSKPNEPEIRVSATRTSSANKLLYAAQPELRSPGMWHLDIRVRTNNEAITVPVNFRVLSADPALVTYWPYFVAVPLGILLFILNQWLKDRLRRSSGAVVV